MIRGIPERLCGRPFSHNELEAIREEVQGGYSQSRMEIAKRVCTRGYKPLAGVQVRYLIRWDGGDLGAIGFSAAAWKVGVRDRWIGWDALSREKGLRLIVNNARFLLLPNIRVKNLASRVLSLSARRVREDFLETYNYEPVLFEDDEWKAVYCDC